jgi:DNA-binding NarL/FixJ family response regulator
MISIALIEDNRLVFEGITTMLNRLPDLRVVAGGGADMSRLSDVDPQVVLLDSRLPNGDALRVAEEVRATLPHAKVIAMDIAAVQEGLVEWVHAGVSGFILKDATLEDLVSTIRSVVHGAKVLPPEMTAALFSQITGKGTAGGETARLELDGLTPREQEVVKLIADGLSNKAIAARLHIAIPTVKSHVRNIMEKLTLRTRLQIAAYAHNVRGVPRPEGAA